MGGKDVQLGGQGISVNLDEPPGPDATEAEVGLHVHFAFTTLVLYVFFLCLALTHSLGLQRDAYYDALARQARESRDKETVEMVAMARPLPSDEPQVGGLMNTLSCALINAVTYYAG